MDDDTQGLATMGIRSWKGLANGREEWRRIVTEAKAYQGLYSQWKKERKEEVLVVKEEEEVIRLE